MPSRVTRNPNGAWITQQARNLAMRSVVEPFSLLICDRDSKFVGAFETVLASEGIRRILTQVRTPVANAYAERFVRTIRCECLDWILIRNVHRIGGTPNRRWAPQIREASRLRFAIEAR